MCGRLKSQYIMHLQVKGLWNEDGPEHKWALKETIPDRPDPTHIRER